MKPRPHDDASYRNGYDKLGPNVARSLYDAGASPEAALGAQRLDDDLSNRPPKLFDPAKELQGCFDYLRRYGGS